VPVWSSAQISGAPLDAVAAAARRPLTEADRNAIVHGVRDAAAEVIASRGATNWAAGLAVSRILEAVLRDENSVLTVSGLTTGHPHLEDVCLSVPRFPRRRGVGELLPVRYSEAEESALRRSAEILRDTARRPGYCRTVAKELPSPARGKWCPIRELDTPTRGANVASMNGVHRIGVHCPTETKWKTLHRRNGEVSLA
jgi:hypothetical protein